MPTTKVWSIYKPKSCRTRVRRGKPAKRRARVFTTEVSWLLEDGKALSFRGMAYRKYKWSWQEALVRAAVAVTPDALPGLPAMLRCAIVTYFRSE